MTAPDEHVAQVRLTDGVTLDLAFEPGSHVLQAIRESGVWERHVTATFMSLFRRSLSQVFFDIGANAGYYSVLVSKLSSPATRIVAFEPQPALLPILQRNLDVNGCRNVRVDTRALGCTAGTGRMITGPEDEMETGFVVRKPDGPLSITTVDDFAAETGLSPTVIKCDAEGMDIDVVAGAERVLGETAPIIFLELQPAKAVQVAQTSFDAVLDLLRRTGYTPLFYKGHNISAAEIITFDILKAIFDLWAEKNLYSFIDIILWPGRLALPARQLKLPQIAES